MSVEAAPPNYFLNPAARLRGESVGQDRSNLVIIDDVLSNADEVVEHVCAHGVFAPPSDTLYPGLNAVMPDAQIRTLMDALHPLLRDAYGAPADAAMGYRGFYSLVTLPPEGLAPAQTIPHIDNLRQFRIAAVLYLCDETFGGTGFFRQKRTGFERITPDRWERYDAACQEELKTRATGGYFQDSDADYERVGQVEARFNRLVIYPSSLLHSGLVKPELLSADPRKGRLTGNLFIGISA